MFTIDIGGREPGLHVIELEPEAESLNLDAEKFKSVGVSARLDVSARRILVSLDVHATAILECDRTLEPFDHEIEGSYELLFEPPEFIEADDDAYNEVRPLDPTDQEIDVTDVVRDTIVLAVPARHVAPGAEEQEIPTEFGTPEDEDAIDPRWAALNKLRSGANQ